jgi:exopolysaccharide biosynthesis protein
LEPGVELREVNVSPVAERAVERLSIVRLDPTDVRLRVHYDPTDPKPISDWAVALNALLVVNGAYFSPESAQGHQTIGLLVSDGQRWGTPLDEYAGMLAVTDEGQVSVRWLQDRPYDRQEPLTQAIQSFPVLVKPGGVMGFPSDADDGTAARRTVVAQDSEGNILLLVAPRGTLSLHKMASFLAESDLTIDVALNLDGGASTGLWLTGKERKVEIDSFAPIPSVIAVERR